MAKIYNTKTRQEEVLPAEQVGEAILAGTHSYGVDDRVDVRDSKGKSWNVPSKDVPGMLKDGYSIETPEQAAVREYVKDNKGLKGTAKVALGQFADEALMGLPEIVYDHSADPLEVAKKEALKKDHEAANNIGGVAGFGASLLYGGPIGKLATGAGKAGIAVAEKAIANRLVEAGVESGTRAIAKSLAKNIAKKGIQYGVEGALMAAPKAITEASLGDTELAAETLMYGGLAGAGLGLGGATLKELGKLGKDAAIKGTEWAAGKAINKLGGLSEAEAGVLSGGIGTDAGIALRDSLMKGNKKKFAEEMIATMDAHPTFNMIPNKTEVAETIYTNLKSKIKANPDINLLQDLGSFGGLEYAVPGLGKVYAAAKAAKTAYDVARDPSKIVTGLLFAEKAMKKAGQGLDAIPAILDDMATATRVSKVPASASSVGAIGRFLGDNTPGEDRREQLKKLSTHISEYNNNPAYAAQVTGAVTNPLAQTGAPGIADAYAMKNALVAKYLSDNIPKPSQISTPFKKVNWKPSDQEVALFERKVHAINNPLSILDDLNKGTLRRESVEAVKTIYPKLFSQIQNKITDHLMKNPTQVPYSSRLKLSMLMELPLGDELLPQNIQYLQDNFIQQDETAPKPSGKAPIMPDMMTETQKLSGS